MTMTNDAQTRRLPGLRWRSALAGGLASLLLAGCSALPGSGPRTGDIERAAQSQYVLVDLTADTAKAVRRYIDDHDAEPPVTLPPPRGIGLVGPGDLLQVTIWEPNPTGTSLTSEKANLQTSTRVGPDGTISVPYVGRLAVAGHTPAQIEAAVTDRMAHEVSGAQVSVLVAEDLTNAVIVQGEVTKPGRYQVVPHASGLLDILAMAGGSAVANRQTQVRITRGNVSVTRTLSMLVATHALEADLSPGDRILVQPRRSFFQAFGAVANPGEQAYDADDISLARTLARLNGLSDGRADPAQVFVFRRQPADLTRALTKPAPGQDPTAVIYRLNLRNPGGFFISQEFPILPNDLLYVSESPLSEVMKVFQVINGAGKSTLIRLLAGTELPDAGRISRGGRRVSFPLGFSATMHPKLTGQENVRFLARLYGEDERDAADRVRDFAELGPYWKMPLETYSSGMRARLAFGACLAIAFDVYLIDEVTAVGDARFRARCLAAFQERMKQADVIMVSHDYETMRAWCDTGAVLHDGRLILFDDLEDAIRHHAGLMRAAPSRILEAV